MRTRILGTLGFLLVLNPARAGDGKKPIGVDDLYRLESARTPVLLRGGEKAVYVRNWIDANTKLERNSLWIAGPARKPLEKDEPDARAPAVSPDGTWIAFVSTRPRPAGHSPIPPVPPESDPAADIWLIRTDGGPAIPLAGPDQKHGRVFHDGFYGRLAFSRDGTKLVFVADDGSDPRTKEEIENDVEIVRPDQGEGYTGYGPAQIWVAHLDPNPGKFAAKKIERLTKDDVWYGDPQWSIDGKALVVVANKTADRESVRYSINRNFDLYTIDTGTGDQRRLTDNPGPDVSPRISPDGTEIAYLTVPRQGSHRDMFNLAVLSFRGGKTQKIRVLGDHHGPDADKMEGTPPYFPLPDDCWDGLDHLVYRTEVGSQSAGSERVNAADGKIDNRDDLKDGVHARAARLKKLLPLDNPFLKERQGAISRSHFWKHEGLRLEGIVTLPPEGVAKRPYKLVLHPHGGPHSRSAFGFDFTVQVLAAHGYAVFQPNFRGSAGYGQKFIDADRADFGGGDMRDILTGIDSLIAEGLVDKDRQFVYGTSYGGYMTTWLVGHTKQFRAAVAQNAVTDLNMMWGLSDLPSWTRWEFEGRPWEQPERYRKHSPLTYADKVQTPTLLLHARQDRRCPLPMGRAFHRALAELGVPTQLVLYPGEGHGIRQPRHREDVLRRVLAWFAKHGG